MPCEPYEGPGGVHAIVCHRPGRAKAKEPWEVEGVAPNLPKAILETTDIQQIQAFARNLRACGQKGHKYGADAKACNRCRAALGLPPLRSPATSPPSLPGVGGPKEPQA